MSLDWEFIDWHAAGTGKAPLFVAESLVDDLEVAVNRLRHATNGDRIHHPATPTEIRRCLDDLADTIERMRG